MGEKTHVTHRCNKRLTAFIPFHGEDACEANEMHTPIARMRRMPPHEFISRLRTGQRIFPNIVMNGANLASLSLAGVRILHSDLSFTNFEAADLTDADFSGTVLSRCTFSRALARNTNFTGATLTFADLTNLRMVSATFRNANLLWADTSGTNLLRANLQGALLTWAYVRDESGLQYATSADQPPRKSYAYGM